VNTDFVSRALESAKSIQTTVAEAVAKGTEAAKPLVADAVAKAQDLQKTIVDQAPQVGEAAQSQLQSAQTHLTTFISTGKDVLARGVEGAQANLTPIAENARHALHQAAKAVTEATAPKPPAPPGA
jgi:hypothetical protein